MSEIDEYLSHAARDEAGEPVWLRVQGRTGQWFVMPLDPDGGPLTGWGPPDTPQAEDAFRDEDGRVLMGAVFLHDGSALGTPLDASLRPVISLKALVSKEGGTMSPNPGGWPLTEEELDRTEPLPEPADLPLWQREAMKDVARDDLGQPLTTRVRAADDGWADVLMTTAGDPLEFQVDLGLAAGGEPQGAQERVTLMRTLGGLVVIALDEHGRPVRSAVGARKLKGEQS